MKYYILQIAESDSGEGCVFQMMQMDSDLGVSNMFGNTIKTNIYKQSTPTSCLTSLQCLVRETMDDVE